MSSSSIPPVSLAVVCLLAQLPLLTLAQGNYVANTASGSSAGLYNTLVGVQAGINITYGDQANVFTGYQAGYANTAGANNIFIGLGTGYNNTTGSQNVAVGHQAGVGSGSGNNNNVSVGYQAGVGSGSVSNAVNIGYQAGHNSTGVFNVFIGSQSGQANTTGYANSFLGAYAGQATTTGAYNSFLGAYAGYANTTGANNSFFGCQAGYNVTTGSNNVIIGPTSGTAITDGSDNILIGYNSQAEEGIFNGIAIGSNSRVATSNSLILGNGVNVGIGTSSPTARLHVRSQQMNESGLRLEQLTSQSPASLATDQFLTVNEKGEVVKARYQLRINHPSDWSDKVLASGYTLPPLSAVAAYVGQHGHLPGVPSAQQVAREGVDLVKLNATLLEKVEELTLYSIQQQKEIERLKHHQQEIDELKRLVKELLEKK